MALLDELLDLATTPRDAISDRAWSLARFSLLDWMACGLAGREEPLARKLRKFAQSEGGVHAASLMGGDKVPARMAALVNGATSHALDYDDTHFEHIGHLSVAIYPAALAVAEEVEASATETILAFLVGAEGAIRMGQRLGRAHYDLGFHQTATSGAFGATLAAGRLYGLTPAQMRMALGLCATRASGLKSQFGTMGKPYNAGIAAANGVECAALAKLGFTSTDDGISGLQGFVETHTPKPEQAAPSNVFLFEDNKYKLHACCHGTHAMIEALLTSKVEFNTLGDVDSVTVAVNPRWLRVCDIKSPRTGLEVKFSYVWLAGMVLRGEPTGDDRAYTDTVARDPELSEFAHQVDVIGDDALGDLQSAGSLRLKDGRERPLHYDLAEPMPEDVLADRLRAKAEAMLGEDGAALWNRLDQLDDLSARDLGSVLSEGKETSPK